MAALATWNFQAMLRYENRVHLHTTSCGDLVATYGTPFYMKVDVEDRIHF